MARTPWLWALACWLAIAGPLSLKAAERVHFDLPAGPAVTMLKRAARDAGVEIVYSAVVVEGVTTQAVRGDFTPREALEQMVARTALQIHEDPASGALSVRRRTETEPLPGPKSSNTMTRKNPIAILGTWLALALAPGHAADSATAAAASASTGVLTGTVSNRATRNVLEGAKVEVPALGVSALTDRPAASF